MTITDTHPPMWMNAAEKFMVEFFKLTRSHMDYSDAIKLINMGYKNAQSFINDCIEYSSMIDKAQAHNHEPISTKISYDYDHTTRFDENGNLILPYENIIDVDDINDIDKLYNA